MPRLTISFILVLFLWSSPASFAQAPAVSGDGPAKPPASQQPVSSASENEISTSDTDTTLKINVNLVLVRVIVRDANGKEVPNLQKEDFELLDNGKPQRISTFSMEAPGSHPATPETAPVLNGTSVRSDAGLPATVNSSAFPQRFLVLVFDDLHFRARDSLAVRDAATRLFGAVAPADRVAIYSASGQVAQDFSSDRETLHKTLLGIVPHANRGEGIPDCPELTYYHADLIENKHDPEALAAAVADASTNCLLTRQDVQVAAKRVLLVGDTETRQAYRSLDAVVRRLATMPGQRILVFLSPGFLTGDEILTESWDLMDLANRSGIVINTVDARGLETPAVLRDIDASSQHEPLKQQSQIDWQGLEQTYRLQSQLEQGSILDSFASTTGGTYFHNRNDLDTAMRQALAAPALSYVLGFAPKELKIDGRFHTLKVSLAKGAAYQLQARRGYFAPKVIADPVEMAKQQVRDALFKQDEILDVPVDLKTQFFKTDAASAQLTIFTHMAVKGIHFKRTNGRNTDELIVATAIYDENGQFVTGHMKEVSMKLNDATLSRLNQVGFTIKMAFDVKPGSYLVRTVVRGAEGPQLSARNGTAVIPN